MNNNKMAEVAALLGVELGEAFDIEGCVLNPYTLTHRGLCGCDDNINTGLLALLLIGKYKITKRPWIPTWGDRYWYINDDGIAQSLFFNSHCGDLPCLAMGNCFPTEAAAEAARSAIAAKYNEIGKDVRGYVPRDWGKGE